MLSHTRKYVIFRDTAGGALIDGGPQLTEFRIVLLIAGQTDTIGRDDAPPL